LTGKTAMRIDIITIFPELFTAFLSESLMGRAKDAGIVQAQAHDLRKWTTDKHHVVDDAPFGGGGGMVLMAGPIVDAVESLANGSLPTTVVIPTARGPLFDQQAADRLAPSERLIIVCGHYKGIDERVFEVLNPQRFSLGNYVLTGGELPAMVMIDAIVRRIPGFIGNADSAADDSFARQHETAGVVLGPPVYTRPAVYRNLSVPEILISGHHAQVEKWRREQALSATRSFRPELCRIPEHGE